MLVLGINTGTSVDGVDLALVRWQKDQIKNFEVLSQVSYEFDPAVKHDIEVLIGMQKGNLKEIADLHFKFSRFLAFIINEFIKEFPDFDIDLIGIHGQTVFHGEQSSLQLGNPSVVAKLTGITTIGDFRSGDIALGGGGAPLTSFIDDQLIRDQAEARATLNIGGIANVSILKPGQPTLAYDTGPGNTLIDCLAKKLYQIDFDKDGLRASQGKVNKNFVENLIRRTSFFHQDPPKSTGRELFGEKFADKFLDLGNKENILASVSFFTCTTIAREINKHKVSRVFVSGGGYKNQYIMTTLRQLCPKIEFDSHDVFGISSQYKEAILFSLLAFTCFNGIENSVPSSTGAKKATILGVIANP